MKKMKAPMRRTGKIEIRKVEMRLPVPLG